MTPPRATERNQRDLEVVDAVEPGDELPDWRPLTGQERRRGLRGVAQCRELLEHLRATR
jgi:hypothetical protein